MKKFIPFIGLVLTCLTLNGQVTGSEVLEKVSSTYKSANTLAFNITFTYYEDVKSIKPLKVSKGFVKMNGTRYLMSIDQVQILRNDTFMVILNNQSKVLMIDSASATPPGNLQAGIPADSLFKYMGNAVLSDKDNAYRVSISNPEDAGSLIKKTELTVNKNTFFIEKITVFYNTLTDDESGASWNPKMTIDYGSIKLNENIDNTVFSEVRFIGKNGKKIVPAAAYKTYELINHLE